MGKNLVLNIESRGYFVLVYNCFFEKIEEFLKIEVEGKNFVGIYSVEEFINFFEKLCKILLMVKVGVVIDVIIDLLKLYLEKGDILIDGGNIFF